MKVEFSLDLPEDVVLRLEDAADEQGKRRNDLLRQLAVRAIDAELATRLVDSNRYSSDVETVFALIGRRNFELLAAHEIEGRSVRELAEQRGFPKSTIHDRLRRVKDTLAEHGLWPIVNKGLRLGREPVEGGALVVGADMDAAK
jgi:DNA-directed RNA polymerase specialized sigma24 family protein